MDGDFVLITVGRSRHRRSAAIFIGSACSEVVLAGFVKRDDHHAVVSTFNHSTVLIPSVGISGITRVASFESDLFTGADIVVANRELRSSRNSANRDVNATRHRTTSVGACRGGCHRVGMVGSGRDSGNGGTGGGHKTLTSPRVSDVVIGEAVQVGVQDNHLAFANFHLVGIHLKVGTVGIDVEGLNSGANIIRSGNRVCTSNRSGEFFTFRIITPNIIIISLRINRSSGDRSRSTITDDVVTRERELRSSINGNSFLIRNRRSVATLSDSLHCEGVLTGSKHIDRQVLEVLTRNLNTVHVPNEVRSFDIIITVGLNTSSQVNLSTSADFSITIIFNSGIDSNNRIHVNSDRTGNLTSTFLSISRSGDIVNNSTRGSGLSHNCGTS